MKVFKCRVLLKELERGWRATSMELGNSASSGSKHDSIRLLLCRVGETLKDLVYWGDCHSVTSLEWVKYYGKCEEEDLEGLNLESIEHEGMRFEVVEVRVKK